MFQLKPQRTYTVVIKSTVPPGTNRADEQLQVLVEC